MTEAKSLRDQLADHFVHKLADHFVRKVGGAPDHLGYGDFLILADECIRQMEWARRECSKQITEALPTTTHEVPYPPGMVEIRGMRIHGLEPLTLAPEDWKP